MNVVLLEFSEEIPCLLADCERRGIAPAEVTIVAMSPDVQVALRRQGLPYRNTLPYFGNESHAAILMTSEKWLETIEASLVLSDGSGITDSYAGEFVFNIRFYINYFLWVVEILEGLVRHQEVATLTVCAATERNEVGRSQQLEPIDRPLPHIVKAFAAARGIGYVELPAPAPPQTQSHRSRGLGRLAGAVMRRAARGVLPGLTSWHRRRISRLGSDVALITSLGYNMDRLVRDLKKRLPSIRVILVHPQGRDPLRKVYRLLFPHPADAIVELAETPTGARADLLTRNIGAALESIQKQLNRSWRAALVHRGVGFVEIFEGKIVQALFPYVQNLARRTAALEAILDETNPRLVLSAHSIDAAALIGELSVRRGVPSLSISHGTFVPPSTRADEIEEYRLGRSLILTTYGYTALQTPWAERYMHHFRHQRAPVPVKTGNLLFARVDAKKRHAARRRLVGANAAGRRIIVYATTLKGRSSLRFQIHETLDEHLAGIRDLSLAVRETPDAHVVVKLHPGGALSERHVRELVPETTCDRVSLIAKLPFAEALSAADLIVSYSSTCIEEAIQNGVPVLLYDRWGRYQHVPALSLDQDGPRTVSPAYYVSDASVLSAALRWILENHDSKRLSAETVASHVYPPAATENFYAFVARCVNHEAPDPRLSATLA